MCKNCKKRGNNCNGYIEQVLSCPSFEPLETITQQRLSARAKATYKYVR